MKVKPKSEQVDKFEEAARALECDESEERFDAALKKVAAHKPPKGIKAENDNEGEDKPNIK
jgi:hypothetical protein